jgi:hypothetical protein
LARQRRVRAWGWGVVIDIHIDEEIKWYRLDDSRRDVQFDDTGNIPAPELAKHKLNTFKARTGEGR